MYIEKDRNMFVFADHKYLYLSLQHLEILKEFVAEGQKTSAVDDRQRGSLVQLRTALLES